MKPSELTHPAIPGQRNDEPAPSLLAVVRKSALLNLVIVLTSGPVLLFAGGPRAVYATLAIMTGITIVIWTATFALYSLAALPGILRTPASAGPHADPEFVGKPGGLADRWID